MKNPPFEDVFPIQDGDFPLLCLFTGVYMILRSNEPSKAVESETFYIHPFNKNTRFS